MAIALNHHGQSDRRNAHVTRSRFISQLHSLFFRALTVKIRVFLFARPQRSRYSCPRATVPVRQTSLLSSPSKNLPFSPASSRRLPPFSEVPVATLNPSPPQDPAVPVRRHRRRGAKRARAENQRRAAVRRARAAAVRHRRAVVVAQAVLAVELRHPAVPAVLPLLRRHHRHRRHPRLHRRVVQFVRW